MPSDRDLTGRRRLFGLIGVGLVALASLIVVPTPAEARGGIGVTVYGGYGGYYGHPHYYYRPRYHYFPPPYYYYPPPPPPPVVYVPVPAPAPQPAPTAAPPPVPTASQTNCREYETTMTIDGRPQKVTGTACLQPDGTWRIIR